MLNTFKAFLSFELTWLEIYGVMYNSDSHSLLSQSGCLETRCRPVPRSLEGMDPLGARSQFVDVQTLPTWQQQLGEDAEETVREQSDSLLSQQAFPSPFPFRADINRKIILLWVTGFCLHAVGAWFKV